MHCGAGRAGRAGGWRALWRAYGGLYLCRVYALRAKLLTSHNGGHTRIQIVLLLATRTHAIVWGHAVPLVKLPELGTRFSGKLSYCAAPQNSESRKFIALPPRVLSAAARLRSRGSNVDLGRCIRGRGSAFISFFVNGEQRIVRRVFPRRRDRR